MYESGLPFQTRVLKYFWIYVNTNAIQTYNHKSHDRNKLRSKFAKLHSPCNHDRNQDLLQHQSHLSRFLPATMSMQTTSLPSLLVGILLALALAICRHYGRRLSTALGNGCIGATLHEGHAGCVCENNQLVVFSEMSPIMKTFSTQDETKPRDIFTQKMGQLKTQGGVQFKENLIPVKYILQYKLFFSLLLVQDCLMMAGFQGRHNKLF